MINGFGHFARNKERNINILSVPKVTAKVWICSILKQMQYTFAVTFGTPSIFKPCNKANHGVHNKPYNVNIIVVSASKCRISRQIFVP